MKMKAKVSVPKRYAAWTAPPAAGIGADAQTLARSYISLIPQMMGALREHLRTAEGNDLRIGQFRMMMAIDRQRFQTVSRAAQGTGLTLPAASKLIDDLVRGDFVRRTGDASDRRRTLLSLTPRGAAVLKQTMFAAQAHLSRLFAPLSREDLALLTRAAETLGPLFALPAGPADNGSRADNTRRSITRDRLNQTALPKHALIYRQANTL